MYVLLAVTMHYLTRFPHTIFFVSLSTTVVTSGSGDNNPSEAHRFTSDFSGVLVARSLVLCVVLCRCKI